MMNVPDMVRDWKDPDYRTGLSEHPSGDIDLSGAGSGPNAGPTLTTTTTVPATEALSCWPACGNSFWKGTCAFLSLGCCG